MADTHLPPPVAQNHGWSGMPDSSGDTHPETPCGNKDHMGEFTGMPDSSGDVHPQTPNVQPGI